MLLNKAIGLENKQMELGEQKRKFRSHGQSSNTHPRFNSSQSSQFSSDRSSGNYLQNSQLQRSTQQFQHFSRQTLHVPNHRRDRLGALMRNNSQFTLMVVSVVENWNGMLASSQIVTSRLPKRTMVKGSDNQHLRYTMEVQILRSIRVNGITCVAE
jgi:hypothetical protein